MHIKLAETKNELEQILALQASNHTDNISIKTKETNGFVTVKHTLDLLLKMNQSAKQIIAVDNNIVVGYALVMLKSFRDMVPVLVPMFNMFEGLYFNGNRISDLNYYVMGQICIKDTHRGQGIFKTLYEKHKAIYATRFDLCITEVSTRNLRSMKAHENVGFKVIHSFQDKTDTWNILLWDWN